jgi:hypothetical protein
MLFKHQRFATRGGNPASSGQPPPAGGRGKQRAAAARAGTGKQRAAAARGRRTGRLPALDSVVGLDMRMPRLLIWTQVLIVVFVLAGIVIAITKLA